MSADTTGTGALRNRLDPHFGQPVMCFEAITVILLRIPARTRSVRWPCGLVRNGLIEKLDARGALVDDNDPNIPVIRPSIRTDPDIVFCLTQPAASVNAVHFRDLAFGSVIAHSPADAHVV